MAGILSCKRQRHANNTRAKLSYWAQKISPVVDHCLEIRDLDEHDEYKIKFVADGGKGPVVVLVYYIL